MCLFTFIPPKLSNNSLLSTLDLSLSNVLHYKRMNATMIYVRTYLQMKDGFLGYKLLINHPISTANMISSPPYSHEFIPIWLTMDGWKDAVDHVLVEVLVFTHLIDFLPLLISHLFFDCLCCHVITIKIFTSKLQAIKTQLLVRTKLNTVFIIP